MIAGNPEAPPRALRRRKTVKAFFAAMLVVLGSGLIGDAQGIREIEIHAEKVGEVDQWMPAKVEVVQGETVLFVFNHDLKGGFDFHGIAIEPLEIKGRVYRHKPLKVEKQIPLTLKPGEYEIWCQYHPKHGPATLIVKEKPS
jgi:plastocyanin